MWQLCMYIDTWNRCLFRWLAHNFMTSSIHTALPLFPFATIFRFISAGGTITTFLCLTTCAVSTSWLAGFNDYSIYIIIFQLNSILVYTYNHAMQQLGNDFKHINYPCSYFWCIPKYDKLMIATSVISMWQVSVM